MVFMFRSKGRRPPSGANLDRARHADDLQLVLTVLDGDTGATEALASRLSCVPQMVRSLHRRFGGHLVDADVNEVIQDTLISLWSKLDRFEGRSRLETWAYGFASKQVLKGLAAARRGPRRVEWDEDEHTQVPEPARTSPEECLAVQEHVDAIGPPDSDIIRMKHFDGLKFHEIADRLSMPTNSVKSRYYRSLERLRTLLRPVWRARHEQELS